MEADSARTGTNALKPSTDSLPAQPPATPQATLPSSSQTAPPASSQPKRFHGSVSLNTLRVGADAGRIAEEIIAHLATLPGATLTVILEIVASLPNGAPDNVIRTVTENCRTLKFTSQGFEKE